MSKRTAQQRSSSNSSQEASPEHKSIKMANDAQDEVPTLSTLYKVLVEVQADTKNILQEFEVLKEEHRHLKKSVAHILEENEQLTKTCKNQAKEIETMKERLSKAEDLLDDMHQYQRKYNLELHGIPEAKGENLESVVEELAQEIDVEDFEESDIDIVHRLPSKLKPRPIIIKFKCYDDKKSFYDARWKLRNFCNDDDGSKINGAKKIYINENLTAQRRQLFNEVRKRVKQYGWHSATTLDGKIFIKREKGGKNYKITKQADLEEYFA